MKKKRFTEEQIAFTLHQSETGTSVEEVIRKLRVEETTVAPERQLAEWIWVMPLQPEQAGGRQSLTLLPLAPPSCPTLPTTNGADGNGHGA